MEITYKRLSTVSEGQRLKHSKAWKIITFVLIILLMLLLFTAAIVVIGYRYGVSSHSKPSLKVLTLTDSKLQGQYYGLSGGIDFESVINTTHISFSITSTDGTPIVLMVRPLDTTLMMIQVNATNFLMMKNEGSLRGFKEFVVSDNHIGTMKSIMRGHNSLSENVLQQLDSKSVKEVSYTSLKHLALSPEANLIVEAAEALGEQGIRGNDSKAALKFYAFAMKLANAREDSSKSNGAEKSFGRAKRAMKCDSEHGGDVCDECPYYYAQGDYINKCFGLCGKGCSCWSWVCGDCCVHEFCHSHDQCCANSGFVSISCLSVAVYYEFYSCTDTYEC